MPLIGNTSLGIGEEVWLIATGLLIALLLFRIGYYEGRRKQRAQDLSHLTTIIEVSLIVRKHLTDEQFAQGLMDNLNEAVRHIADGHGSIYWTRALTIFEKGKP